MPRMLYRHTTAQGTPYEIGLALGRRLAQDKELIRCLTTPLFGGDPLPLRQVENTAKLFETYIPGIHGEMQGFADAARVSYADLVIYSSYLSRLGGCSHFVVRDAAGNLRHARNYDYGLDEAPMLLAIHSAGNYAHTGFGCKVFGRFDGMNEKGLCVTTASADVNHTGPMGEGFVFPMVVRALLERCGTAYEAKELLLDMPYAEYRNFLLSDASGDAVLVEASPERKACRSIGARGFLCSADHFILESCAEIRPVRHSLARQRVMERRLAEKADIRALLEEVAFSYYSGGMGTLWSAIYEPRAGRQTVCLGSPVGGVWRDVAEIADETEVELIDVAAPEDLWI